MNLTIGVAAAPALVVPAIISSPKVPQEMMDIYQNAQISRFL
jgi:hypothetical protein